MKALAPSPFSFIIYLMKQWTQVLGRIRIMFVPISIDDFIKSYKKRNPEEDAAALK